MKELPRFPFGQEARSFLMLILDRMAEFAHHLFRRDFASFRLTYLQYASLHSASSQQKICCIPLDSVYMRLSQNSQPNSDTPDMNSRKER